MRYVLAGLAAAVLAAAGLAGAAPAFASCAGVALTPADNVQAALDSSPPGTMFCFGAGTYAVSSLVPKDGDVLDGGGQAAILDGGNSAQYAIYGDGTSPGPSGVTVTGFVIRHYATPLQRGAVQDYNGADWVIQGNSITQNAAAAVATGDGVQVLGNSLDNNAQEGFSAHGGGLYQGNDISGNNAALAVDGTWEAGGGKAWGTTGLTFRDNTVNGNGGAGLWADTNNIGTVFDGNTVTCNWGPGIYEEISYNFTITGNDVENNSGTCAPGGGQRLGWAWDAGIQVRRSQGLAGFTSVISGNKVAGNFNGITLVDSPDNGCTGSGEGQYGPCKVANVSVTGNGVTMAQGATGAYSDGFTTSNIFADGNTFAGDDYCVAAPDPPNGDPSYGWLAWDEPWPSWAQWQGDGNDAAGSFTVTSAACAVPGASPSPSPTPTPTPTPSPSPSPSPTPTHHCRHHCTVSPAQRGFRYP